MPIAPNPRRNTKPSLPEEDRKAEAFISKAGATMPTDADTEVSLKPIMIRFPRHILARIDREAKQLGITRTAFIVQSAAEKLNRLEREAR
ncbi:MAG TPA: hypothetical protein VHD85_01630 [Terracidiphilus sp.]|jgi:hypothetical protein|nr:hypothetical protein [Terracidiphilus sp.]